MKGAMMTTTTTTNTTKRGKVTSRQKRPIPKASRSPLLFATAGMLVLSPAAQPREQLIALSSLLPSGHGNMVTCMFRWADANYMHRAFGARRPSWKAEAEGRTLTDRTGHRPTPASRRLSARSASPTGVGYKDRSEYISKIFRNAYAEELGQRDPCLMPHNELALHRRAICAWLRSQYARHVHVVADPLPPLLQYTPHDDLLLELDDDEGSDDGALCPPQVAGGLIEEAPTTRGAELVEEPAPPPIRGDELMEEPPLGRMCKCPHERGFSAQAWRAQPAPVTTLRTSDRGWFFQPAIALGVQSWALSEGKLDQSILTPADAYARACDMDDLVVRKNGQQGAFVHKNTTKHPSPDRRHEGLCHGGGRLGTYSLRGICSDPNLWPMNHM